MGGGGKGGWRALYIKEGYSERTRAENREPRRDLQPSRELSDDVILDSDDSGDVIIDSDWLPRAEVSRVLDFDWLPVRVGIDIGSACNKIGTGSMY